MAHRENLPNGKTRITLSISERLALKAIIDKISRDKSMTELWQYRQAGSFDQLLDNDRETGDYKIPDL